jgi:hypothetical protein
VKKVLVFLLAAVLFWSFFRELNIVKTLLICLGLGAAYVIYRIPAKHIVAMKYPFILLTLGVTAGFLVYPHTVISYPLNAFVVFVSFYGLTFYLVTIEEKGKSFFKEVTALSIIFLSSAFNLSMIGGPVLVFAISIAATLFLFIVGKLRLTPFLAGYTLLIAGLLLSKKTALFGGAIRMSDMETYLLLAASFIFLVLGFVGFVKKADSVKLLLFFGFLYVSVDLFMVMGFRLSAGLLHQPVAALLIVTPLVGIMLKTEKERL